MAAVVVGLALSGCLDIGDDATSRGIRTLRIYDGTVRVRAPDGYCIDQRASQERDGFVVMSGCAIVSDVAIMPTALALITVQVGPAGSAIVSGSEAELAELLQNAEGAVMLSPYADAGTIEILSVDARIGQVDVAFTDRGAHPVSGLGDQEWRAFFDLGGRSATVAVRAYAHTPLGDRPGKALLAATVRSVIDVNLETSALVNR